MSVGLLEEIDAEEASAEEAPASAGFRPFGYQQTAFDAAMAELEEKGRASTLVTAATGTGKTVIAGMFCDEFANRRRRHVLFLAHRDELLEGAQKDIAFVGVHSAIEKAEQYARRTILDAACDLLHPRDIRVVVASVQSLQGARLASWPRDYFDLIITDEAHHSVRGKVKGRGKNKRVVTEANEQYAAIYRHFFGAKRIGLTATPRRKDRAQMGYWYESVAFQYPITAAIRDGNLVEVEEAKCDTAIDLKQVNMGAEDLNQGDLEDAISPYIEKMVRDIKKKIGDRKAIIFCPGRKVKTQKVRPCEAFAEGLRKLNITAVSVWGDHPDRQAINRGFREGEWQVVCNADLYSEGVNFPFVEAVVLASPTASPVVMGQRVGRGTRLHTFSCGRVKDKCLVVTFDWQFDDHKLALISPYEIMIPDGAEDVTRIAARLMAEGETNLLKAAEDAREIADEERLAREAEEARLKAEKEAAKAKAEELRKARQEAQDANRERLRQEALRLRVSDGDSGRTFTHRNPFASALDLARDAMGDARPTMTGHKPATPKQVNELMSDYGLEHAHAAAMTVDEAVAMKKWLFNRYRENKATWPQYQSLLRHGVDKVQAAKMSKPQAGAVIDAMKQKNARRSG